MPIIRVEMWEGRSVEQKRRLVRDLTGLVAEIIECDPATVRVLIDDYPRENWAVGGVLQSDRESTPTTRPSPGAADQEVIRRDSDHGETAGCTDGHRACRGSGGTGVDRGDDRPGRPGCGTASTTR